MVLAVEPRAGRACVVAGAVVRAPGPVCQSQVAALGLIDDLSPAFDSDHDALLGERFQVHVRDDEVREHVEYLVSAW